MRPMDLLAVGLDEVQLLMDFTPDDRALAVVSRSEPSSIHLWDIITGSRIATLQKSTSPGSDDELTTLAFDRRGGLLAAGAKDGAIDIWDLNYLWLGLPFPYSEDGANELLNKIEHETALRLVGTDTPPTLPSFDRIYGELTTFLEFREFGKTRQARSRIQESQEF